jgi:CubicO group peptidase (beta-lactamase class C family)
VPSVDDLLYGRPPSKYGPVGVDKAHDGTDRYSGAGFLIAQMVLEDMLGTTFDRLAEELVFAPLGMTRSSFLHPMPARFHSNFAAGHGDDGRPHPGGWMISSEMAAGGLVSTAGDYARFMLGVRAAWLGEGGLLSRAIAREMMTRVERSSFGLGARVLGSGESLRFNHGGSNDGYQSESNAYLETGNGAVVLTNSTSGLFLWKEVMNGIADVYGWPGFLPPPKHNKQMTLEEKQRYVGAYRIEVGIELPRINIWIEDGVLLSEIPGLRFGVQEAFLDENGTMYTGSGAFDVHVDYGPDGRAERLRVMEGELLVISARRED